MGRTSHYERAHARILLWVEYGALCPLHDADLIYDYLAEAWEKDDIDEEVMDAEDRCAAAEAATRRAEEKIEALTGQLSDARRECEALRAALANVNPAHHLIDGSND